MWEIILDSIIDSLKILPFVFVIYIIIELIENKSATKIKTTRLLSNKYAPLFGATIGVVPQCGFSVVATKLYQEGYILAGTLLSVYIATSDEAIPIMLSSAVSDVKVLGLVWQVILIKFLFAIVVGFVVNFFLRKRTLNTFEGQNIEQKHHHEKETVNKTNSISVNSTQDIVSNKTNSQTETVDCIKENDDVDIGCCHHEIAEQKGFWGFIKHPLIHSVKIFAYVLIVNVIFGIIINYWIGIDNLAKFMVSVNLLQPFVVGLIGLIPNCASSVVITQLLINNTISLGAGVAGLAVNSGIALAVLFSDKAKIKSNLLLLAILYFSCCLLGLVISLFA